MAISAVLFVTPPFAGYVSGHSTFSRAAAEVLSIITGSPYFPGGIGEFKAEKDRFLSFESGPSVDVVLQWATYKDAADECGLSRIWEDSSSNRRYRGSAVGREGRYYGFQLC